MLFTKSIKSDRLVLYQDFNMRKAMMKRVSVWYSYREHPTDVCQGCEGWEESMLNMASEQRTEPER